jgi:hypothetical protein
MHSGAMNKEAHSIGDILDLAPATGGRPITTLGATDEGKYKRI